MYDMKVLDNKLKTLEARAPEATKAFWAFDKAAMAPGAISGKYKELMALAVAFTTRCPYCIQIHAGRAREQGATGSGNCGGREWYSRAAGGSGDDAWHSRFLELGVGINPC